MQTQVAKHHIDVRVIAPRERHALIFSRFDDLAPGEALELVADHDPRPLRSQFDLRSPRQFGWTYVETGPERWRMLITRLAAGAAGEAGDSCCGSGGSCCA
ncbi:MAG: DUF2249 domain-containing protein [Burkholderiales bacterium]|nr:DUF2249 domain-containing protein [Burkholderiales bacterium]MDE2394844.1 DUF2249 domain-containing protein [Burkholderiales bacterium]MDE2456149.1 DUF2249 domain-containing protein [Burkholderiales bacterium]